MDRKRVLDLVLVVPGMIVLAPVMLLIACWVRVDAGKPVFFTQERVGRGGSRFRIIKFRTMVPAVRDDGMQLTVGGDRRITRSGSFLRKYKLDELPQLINVLKGEMSLVGPRPEVPRYVAMYPESIRELVLSVRPGITDPASVSLMDESSLLAQVDDPEEYYVRELLPRKLAAYRNYVLTRSLRGDLSIILRTLSGMFCHRA
ncbi:MAG TPA: sugar transferase [Gammaproteobacteria bacterium]|nr:sugar transferase [Gammaproteobacteria bacterium]